VSIEEKVTTEFGEVVTLYRWTCALCERSGMWLRDIRQATSGRHFHADTESHRQAAARRKAARK